MPLNLTATLNLALNQGAVRSIQNQLAGALTGASGLNRLSSDASGVAKAFTSIGDAADYFGRQSALALRRFAAFEATAGTMLKVANAIKQGVSETISYNRELVRFAQVGNDGAGQIQRVNQEISRLSTSLGVSSSELAKAATTFRQAGLDAEQTRQALEGIAKANLAPNFNSMKQTVEGAIAVMSQFRKEGKDIEAALGQINAVAGAFAVESSDLISGIQKAGGAFRTAGGSLEEFLGLFTAVRATTRESAEEIATGLRTIFGRIQKQEVVSGLEAMQINLRRTREEALALGNVNLKDQFVGPFEAFRRISEALTSLDPTSQRYSNILETLGGYRQLDKIIPLVQEFSTATKAVSVAQAGQISLTISAEKAQDAYAVKLGEVKETFLELMRGFGQSAPLKEFVSQLITLTKVALDAADKLKPLLPLLLGKFVGASINAAVPYLQGFGQALLSPSGQLAPRRSYMGGRVGGAGNGDSQHYLLSPDEYVLPAQTARRIGYDRLDRMRKFADGGIVKEDLISLAKMAGITPYNPGGVWYGSKRTQNRLLDLGIDDQRLRNIAGILPGSSVSAMASRSIPGGVDVDGFNHTRTIYPDLSVYNRRFFPGKSGSGAGTESYVRQLLFGEPSSVKMQAAGSGFGLQFSKYPATGYYVWPSKFGANARLNQSIVSGLRSYLYKYDDQTRQRLASVLRPGIDIQDLLAVPGGDELWRVAGEQLNAKIDPNSELVKRKLEERLLSYIAKRRGPSPGFALGFANGGRIGRVGGASNGDSQLHMLAPDEYVLDAQTARRVGYDRLDRLRRNTGGRVEMAVGGGLDPYLPAIQAKYATHGFPGINIDSLVSQAALVRTSIPVSHSGTGHGAYFPGARSVLAVDDSNRLSTLLHELVHAAAHKKSFSLPVGQYLEGELLEEGEKAFRLLEVARPVSAKFYNQYYDQLRPKKKRAKLAEEGLAFSAQEGYAYLGKEPQGLWFNNLSDGKKAFAKNAFAIQPKIANLLSSASEWEKPAGIDPVESLLFLQAAEGAEGVVRGENSSLRYDLKHYEDLIPARFRKEPRGRQGHAGGGFLYDPSTDTMSGDSSVLQGRVSPGHLGWGELFGKGVGLSDLDRSFGLRSFIRDPLTGARGDFFSSLLMGSQKDDTKLFALLSKLNEFGKSSRDYNTALRAGAGLDPYRSGVVDLLDQFTRQSIPRDLRLFRGIPGLNLAGRPGDTIRDPAFTFTSLHQAQAESYLGDGQATLLEILANKGSAGAYTGFLKKRFSPEVLLPRNAALNVLGRDEQRNLTRILASYNRGGRVGLDVGGLADSTLEKLANYYGGIGFPGVNPDALADFIFTGGSKSVRGGSGSFYPRAKSIYVANDVNFGGNLLHELTHAALAKRDPVNELPDSYRFLGEQAWSFTERLDKKSAEFYNRIYANPDKNKFTNSLYNEGIAKSTSDLVTLSGASKLPSYAIPDRLHDASYVQFLLGAKPHIADLLAEESLTPKPKAPPNVVRAFLKEMAALGAKPGIEPYFLRRASGGLVPGQGDTDSVPLDLPAGSFVLRKDAVNKIGQEKLSSLMTGKERSSSQYVPTLLTPGEMWFGPEEARAIGYDRLDRMNRMGFAGGGRVGLATGGLPFPFLLALAQDPNLRAGQVGPGVFGQPADLANLAQGTPGEAKQILSNSLSAIKGQIQRRDPNVTDADAEQQARAELVRLLQASQKAAQERLKADQASAAAAQTEQQVRQQLPGAVGGVLRGQQDLRQRVDDLRKARRGSREADRAERAAVEQATEIALDPFQNANVGVAIGRRARAEDRVAQLRDEQRERRVVHQEEVSRIRLDQSLTPAQRRTQLADESVTYQAEAAALNRQRLEAERRLARAAQREAAVRDQAVAGVENDPAVQAARQTAQQRRAILAQAEQEEKISRQNLDQRKAVLSQVRDDEKAAATLKKEARAAAAEATKAEKEAAVSVQVDAAGRQSIVSGRLAKAGPAEPITGPNSLQNLIEEETRRRLGTGPVSKQTRQETLDAVQKEFEKKYSQAVASQYIDQGVSAREARRLAQDRLEHARQFGVEVDPATLGDRGVAGKTSTRGTGFFNSLRFGGLSGIGQYISDNRFAALQLAQLAPSFIADAVAPKPGEAQNIALRGSGFGAFTATSAAAGTLSGAAFGAAVGGQFGTVAGLPGAAVGAVVGALYGLATSLQNAAKEITEAKLGKAVTDLGDQLNLVTGTPSLLNASRAGTIRTSLREVGQFNAEKAAENSAHLFGAIPGSNASFLTNLQRQERTTIGGVAPQLVQFLNAQSEFLVKARPGDVGREGEIKENIALPLDKLFEKFLGGNEGLNRQLIGKLAGAQGISFNDQAEVFKKVLADQQRGERTRTAQVDAQKGFVQTVNSLESLANAVHAASVASQQFATRLKAAQGVFEGQPSAPGLRDLPDIGHLIGSPDRAQFATVLRSVTGSLGGGGAQFEKTALAVNAVSSILPEVIAEVRRGSPLSAEGYATPVGEALRRNLGVGGAVSPEVENAIQTVLGNFNREKFTSLLEGSGFDVGKLSKTITGQLTDPLKAAFSQMARDIQEGGNRLIEGLNQIAHNSNAILEAQGQGDQIALERTRTLTRFQAEREGSPSTFLDRLSSQTLQAPFTNRIGRLLEGTGVAGQIDNPEAIGKRLADVREEIARAEQQRQNALGDRRSVGGDAFGPAAQNLSRLTVEASNLQNALKALSDTSRATAGLQEKLNRLTHERDERRGLGANLLTAEPEQLANFERGLLLAQTAVSQKFKIDNFSVGDRQSLFAALQQLRNITLPGLGGDTGGDIINKIVESTLGGKFKLTGDQQKEKSSLEQSIEKQLSIAEKASETYVNGQERVNQNLAKTLADSQRAFFLRLEALEIKRRADTLGTERDVKIQEERTLKDKGESIGTVLGAFGIKPGEQGDLDISRLSNASAAVSAVFARAAQIKDLNKAFGGLREQVTTGIGNEELSTPVSRLLAARDPKGTRNFTGSDEVKAEFANILGEGGITDKEIIRSSLETFINSVSAAPLSYDGRARQKFNNQDKLIIQKLFDRTLEDAQSKSIKALTEGDGKDTVEKDKKSLAQLRRELARQLGESQEDQAKPGSLTSRTVGAALAGQVSFEVLKKTLENLNGSTTALPEKMKALGEAIDILNQKIRDTKAEAAAKEKQASGLDNPVVPVTARGAVGAVLGGAGIYGFASGGPVLAGLDMPDWNPSGPDRIRAMLSEGEYVMPTDKTRKYLPLLEAMRKGQLPVTAAKGGVFYMAGGGPLPPDPTFSGLTPGVDYPVPSSPTVKVKAGGRNPFGYLDPVATVTNADGSTTHHYDAAQVFEWYERERARRNQGNAAGVDKGAGPVKRPTEILPPEPPFNPAIVGLEDVIGDARQGGFNRGPEAIGSPRVEEEAVGAPREDLEVIAKSPREIDVAAERRRNALLYRQRLALAIQRQSAYNLLTANPSYTGDFNARLFHKLAPLFTTYGRPAPLTPEEILRRNNPPPVEDNRKESVRKFIDLVKGIIPAIQKRLPRFAEGGVAYLAGGGGIAGGEFMLGPDLAKVPGMEDLFRKRAGKGGFKLGPELAKKKTQENRFIGALADQDIFLNALAFANPLGGSESLLRRRAGLDDAFIGKALAEGQIAGAGLQLDVLAGIGTNRFGINRPGIDAQRSLASRLYGLRDESSRVIPSNRLYQNAYLAQFGAQEFPFFTNLGGLNGPQVPLPFAMGGHVQSFSNGGDVLPAYLANGEYVLPRHAVNRIGVPALDAARMATGGVVGNSLPTGGPAGASAISGANFEDFLRAVTQMETPFKTFSADVLSLSKSFSQFSQAVTAFTEASKTMKGELTVGGNKVVEVVINGAEVLTKITPDVAKMIKEQTTLAIQEAFKDKLSYADV